MAWTYSGNPASSALDEVRFLSGDTDSTNQQISNEEIAYLLGEWNNSSYTSAAFACEAIAGKYSSRSDSSRSVGDLSISTQFGASAKTFLERAARLRSTAMRVNPPFPNWDVDGYPVTSEISIGIFRNNGSGTSSVPPIKDYPE